MCEFYDPSVANACREPVADAVGDKERANFCGYFHPATDVDQSARDDAGRRAHAELSALFGLPTDTDTTPEPGDELQRLFGESDDDADPVGRG